MAQPKFDLGTWQTLLSLRSQTLRGSLYSVSPLSIVVREDWRARTKAGQGLGPQSPATAVVLGKGESAERHHTKVGGLPYRPAELPWPIDSFGRPMSFMVQFNFADAGLGLSDLPGDVLLVFVRTDRGYLSAQIGVSIEPDDTGALAFEWHLLGIDKLVVAAQIPRLPPIAKRDFQVQAEIEPLASDSFVIPTCYGVHYSTGDCIDEQQAIRAFEELVSDDLLPDNEFMRQASLRALARFPGMKLGGLPFWYSPPLEAIRGRFICSFSGVAPIVDGPYPWVNQAEPLSFGEGTCDDNFLIFRDGACINVFLEDDGSTRWIADFL